MCEPATLSLIAAGATVAAGGLAAYSSYQSGQTNKDLAESNAKIAEYQAADAQRRGAIEEEEERNRIRAILGAQRATYGANNVVSSTGTPLGLLSQTAYYGEIDALTVRNNAAREAFGYRTDAVHSRVRGKLAGREGNLGAGSSLLTSGSQAYGIWRTRPK